MKSFIQEFKEFALKGSVIDLAVGVVIGGAFGKIVSALVADIITPILGFMTGNINLANIKFGQFALGDFLQEVIDFIIIALAIFVAIKFINLLRRKEASAPAPTIIPSREEVLLAEIRDALKEKDGKRKS